MKSKSNPWVLVRFFGEVDSLGLCSIFGEVDSLGFCSFFGEVDSLGFCSLFGEVDSLGLVAVSFSLTTFFYSLSLIIAHFFSFAPFCMHDPHF